METTTPKTGSDPFTESERAALVNLLGDDDPQIYAIVRARILAQASATCAWLRPHLLSNDPLTRKRVHGILLHCERRDADHKFISFCLCQGEGLDLEIGALLLARTSYPEINAEAYHALLDEFAADLRPRLDPADSPREQLATLNHHVFTELGFRGNEEAYFDPQNSYLNRVIDRRIGNPISLCTIYLLIARRLKLPVVGIGLPGHFLCRYQTPVDSVYIDAFDRGRLLTKADCIHHLVHSAFGLHKEFLTSVPPRRMLMRMCGNLHQSYRHLDLHADAARLQGYLVTLMRRNTS